jgi:hypothetical protein
MPLSGRPRFGVRMAAPRRAPGVRTAPPRQKLPQRRNAHAGQGKRRGVAAAGGRVANRRHRCRNAEFLAGQGLRPGRCGVAANPGGGAAGAGAGDGVAGGAWAVPAARLHTRPFRPDIPGHAIEVSRPAEGVSAVQYHRLGMLGLS